MKRTILLFTSLFFIFLFMTGMAFANRFVVINGELQDPEHIYAFEQTCGPVADGSYWVNWNTGDWGYLGNWFPQGNLNEMCSADRKRENSNSQDLTWRDDGLLSTHDLCPECELALP